MTAPRITFPAWLMPLGYVLLGGGLATLVFLVPIVGPILSLPFIPLLQLYEHLWPGTFTATGAHVEIGFLWIGLRSVMAYLFYGSAFTILSALCYVGYLLYHALRQRWGGLRSGCVLLVVCLVFGWVGPLLLDHYLTTRASERSIEEWYRCAEEPTLLVDADGWIFAASEHLLVGVIDATNATLHLSPAFAQLGTTSRQQYREAIRTCPNEAGRTLSDQYLIREPGEHPAPTQSSE